MGSSTTMQPTAVQSLCTLRLLTSFAALMSIASATTGECPAGFYRSSAIVFPCSGAFGSISLWLDAASAPDRRLQGSLGAIGSGNRASVGQGVGTKTLGPVATKSADLPVGMNGFQAIAKGPRNFNLQLFDATLGFIVVAPSGAPVNSTTRTGTYRGLTISYIPNTQGTLPTVESIQVSGRNSMQLVLQASSDQATNGFPMGLSYTIGALNPCPSTMTGCDNYNKTQVAAEVSLWGMWVTAVYKTSGKAWAALALPNCDLNDTSGVPWHRWSKVWDVWPDKTSDLSWRRSFAFLDTNDDGKIESNEFNYGVEFYQSNGKASWSLPALSSMPPWATPVLIGLAATCCLCAGLAGLCCMKNKRNLKQTSTGTYRSLPTKDLEETNDDAEWVEPQKVSTPSPPRTIQMATMQQPRFVVHAPMEPRRTGSSHAQWMNPRPIWSGSSHHVWPATAPPPATPQWARVAAPQRMSMTSYIPQEQWTRGRSWDATNTEHFGGSFVADPNVSFNGSGYFPSMSTPSNYSMVRGRSSSPTVRHRELSPVAARGNLATFDYHSTGPNHLSSYAPSYMDRHGAASLWPESELRHQAAMSSAFSHSDSRQVYGESLLPTETHLDWAP